MTHSTNLGGQEFDLLGYAIKAISIADLQLAVW